MSLSRPAAKAAQIERVTENDIFEHRLNSLKLFLHPAQGTHWPSPKLFFRKKKKWSLPASVRAHRRHFENGTLPRDGGPTDGHNNNKPRISPGRGPPTWYQHRTTANEHRYPRRGPWCDHSPPSENIFSKKFQRSDLTFFFPVRPICTQGTAFVGAHETSRFRISGANRSK